MPNEILLNHCLPACPLLFCKPLTWFKNLIIEFGYRQQVWFKLLISSWFPKCLYNPDQASKQSSMWHTAASECMRYDLKISWMSSSGQNITRVLRRSGPRWQRLCLGIKEVLLFCCIFQWRPWTLYANRDTAAAPASTACCSSSGQGRAFNSLLAKKTQNVALQIENQATNLIITIGYARSL